MTRRSHLGSLGFALYLTAGVTMVTPPGVDAKSERERDLGEIRLRIEQLEQELRGIDDETSGLEAELRRTETEYFLQQRQVEEARAERALAEEALNDSERRMRVLEERLEVARRGLRLRLASLYRFSEGSLLETFLAADTRGESLENLRLVRLVTRRDAYWVDRYLAGTRALEFERAKLEIQRQELLRVTALEEERLRRLARTKTTQKRALEVMAARRAGISEQTSALVDKSERLALLLSILAGRELPSPGEVDIQSFEGVLDWPLAGEIVQGFGFRSDARYNTRIPHNGIEISAADGKEVRVVFPGIVVFSAPFEDFGMTVVVHHPERVFSLYAGLDSLTVAKDDVLSFSDILGVTRGNLYFEIRVENRPRDPMDWLR